MVRLPGSEQRLRRHVLQPESFRKATAWSNAEFDDLVNQGKAGRSRARLEIYKQAERVIQEDVGTSRSSIDWTSTPSSRGSRTSP